MDTLKDIPVITTDSRLKGLNQDQLIEVIKTNFNIVKSAIALLEEGSALSGAQVYNGTTKKFRHIVRNDVFCLDVTLDEIGFEGIQDVNWENVSGE